VIAAAATGNTSSKPAGHWIRPGSTRATAQEGRGPGKQGQQRAADASSRRVVRHGGRSRVAAGSRSGSGSVEQRRQVGVQFAGVRVEAPAFRPSGQHPVENHRRDQGAVQADATGLVTRWTWAQQQGQPAPPPGGEFELGQGSSAKQQRGHWRAGGRSPAAGPLATGEGGDRFGAQGWIEVHLPQGRPVGFGFKRLPAGLAKGLRQPQSPSPMPALKGFCCTVSSSIRRTVLPEGARCEARCRCRSPGAGPALAPCRARSSWGRQQAIGHRPSRVALGPARWSEQGYASRGPQLQGPTPPGVGPRPRHRDARTPASGEGSLEGGHRSADLADLGTHFSMGFVLRWRCWDEAFGKPKRFEIWACRGLLLEIP